MSFQASLDSSPSKDLQHVQQYLEEIIEDSESYLPRVEPDFDENARYDVFLQTEDYNVFLTDQGLQFHGIERENIRTGWSQSSIEAWEYIESEYLEEGERLEENLVWM